MSNQQFYKVQSYNCRQHSRKGKRAVNYDDSDRMIWVQPVMFLCPWIRRSTMIISAWWFRTSI